MQPADIMNAQDVARYLRLSKNTVYALAKSGQIASYKVGRKLRFSLEDVQAYVASTHQATDDEAPLSAENPLAPQAGQTATDNDELVAAASFGKLPGEPFIVEGEDAAGDILIAALRSAGIASEYRARASYTALVDLYAGKAHAAVVHLYDQKANSYNIPAVRALAPGASVRIYRLYAREQGLIVQKGNPKHLTTWGGLLHEGVRIANRTKGSGARVLLDEKLRVLEARSETIEGYDTETASPQSAITRVAEGLADATIGTRREAQSNRYVQFVPLQTEWVDIVIAKTQATRPLTTALGRIFKSEQAQHDFSLLEPSDLGKLGAIIFDN